MVRPPSTPQADVTVALRRVCVLLNKGGRVVERGPDTLQRQLRDGFAAAGIEADIRLIAGGTLRLEAERARDAAKAGEFDAVIGGGGDGSVGTLAGVLADTGVLMGALPLGTLNHFAKDLGMPLELDAAVAALAAGRTRAIDVGEINGIVFVNNAVLGVYPYMVTDRERRREQHGLGKWVAMSLAFLRVVGRFPKRRLKLALPGGEVRYRTPLLFVGVNEYHMKGMELRRRAGMDGGELWLFVAKHGSPWRFVWFALRSAFGGLDEADDFDLHRSTAVKIITRTSRLPVAHDGEVDRLRVPLRLRIRPKALRVLIPPG